VWWDRLLDQLREMKETTGARGILNKYGYAVAGVILVFACVMLFARTRTVSDQPTYAGNQDLAFFVDEKTGEEKVMPADQVPPLAGKDGSDSVVIAVKFKSDTESSAKTYYFVKYPVGVRDRVKALPKDDIDRMNLLERSRLVRSVEAGSKWLRATDPEAEKVVVVPDSAPGHPRRPVFPARL